MKQTVIRLGALLASAALVAGCSSDPEPVYQDGPAPEAVVSDYDESLEPSAAVLALVPTEADTVMITDFEQARLALGFGTGEEAAPEDRAKFWRRLPRTAALSMGILRPADDRLREEFKISQDDVAWEATYLDGSDGTTGWVLAFRRTTSMAAVARAVKAEVGPLRGAVVDVDRRLVTSTTPPEATASWGADPTLVALGGREAISTFLTRECLSFDSIFGAGMQEQLAAAPAAALRAVDELDSFAVALGTELATVLLGANRSDAFDRARLAEIMPPTDPEFPLVMSRPVADPSSGRLGYTLSDPAAAAELTRTGHLPFAVCRG